MLLLAAAAVAKPLEDVSTTIASNAEIEGTTAAPVNILNQESNEETTVGQQQEAISGRNFGSVTVLGDQVCCLYFL